ncbi:hypothetical protein GCM10008967_04180 [Bacillus carboniphilus]|uniref:DUF3889 domain-containing protein n=1 Tax=Bacillus carboniphilus TaxID=86663 RepID=A0ABN0VT79_9BACI
MYQNYYYGNPYGQYQANSYGQYSYYDYRYHWFMMRQQPVRGQASWTDGGNVTKCGIPWSDNKYMTVAVSQNSPYQCGESLKVRNLSTPGGREVIVTVVDQVAGYPANKINLHRKAFETLGASTNQGVINVEIIPSPELEQEKWGKYLLELTQTAYPGYQVKDYKTIGKTEVSAEQTREVYEFNLQSPQESIKVRGTVLYNPKTDRVISFDLKEV